jgi:hypothetical protein
MSLKGKAGGAEYTSWTFWKFACLRIISAEMALTPEQH